jgi:redox-sensitive bicupin YhaK (pirin superfamily)
MWSRPRLRSSRSGSSRQRKAVRRPGARNRFPRRIAQDALPIRAQARVLATTLRAGESAEYAPRPARNLYLVPATGAIEINGMRVNARDGAAITDEARLKITALEDSELVLVDAA